jgi:hypothetical protein
VYVLPVKKYPTFWSSRIVINLDCNVVIFYLIAGPKLPKKLEGASLLPSPDGQGVIVIGGWSGGDGYQSSIYKLICDQLECKWSTMTQQLKIARKDFVAMLIPDTIKTNCTKT